MAHNVENPKSFGTTVGVFCCLVAAFQLWRGRAGWALGFGVVGVLLLAFAFMAPAVLTGPSRVWWRVARTLAWVNTRIILSLLFFLVFTPVSLILRLIGRDSMQRGQPRRASGWVTYPERVRTPKHYDRMF